MNTMDKIRMFPQSQAAAGRKPAQEEECPTCKFPLADTAHGWIKEYRDHTCNDKCLQRYGFCLIPCPTCTGGVEAKRQARLINDLFQDSKIPHYARDCSFPSYPEDADQKPRIFLQTRIRHRLAARRAKAG